MGQRGTGRGRRETRAGDRGAQEGDGERLGQGTEGRGWRGRGDGGADRHHRAHAMRFSAPERASHVCTTKPQADAVGARAMEAQPESDSNLDSSVQLCLVGKPSGDSTADGPEAAAGRALARQGPCSGDSGGPVVVMAGGELVQVPVRACACASLLLRMNWRMRVRLRRSVKSAKWNCPRRSASHRLLRACAVHT